MLRCRDRHYVRDSSICKHRSRDSCMHVGDVYDVLLCPLASSEQGNPAWRAITPQWLLTEVDMFPVQTLTSLLLGLVLGRRFPGRITKAMSFRQVPAHWPERYWGRLGTESTGLGDPQQ